MTRRLLHFMIGLGTVITFSACGLLRNIETTIGHALCPQLDLANDSNVHPTQYVPTGSTTRRVLVSGDSWHYRVSVNVEDFYETSVLQGSELDEVVEPTAMDVSGLKILQSTSHFTECPGGFASDNQSRSYFVQNGNGLLCWRGSEFQSADGTGVSTIIEPSDGQYCPTPEILTVGAEYHGSATYDDGTIVRFDSRVASNEFVEVPFGAFEAIRIERAYSSEFNGQVFLSNQSTDWFVPELGQSARTRITSTEFLDKGNIRLTVTLMELDNTSISTFVQPGPPPD